MAVRLLVGPAGSGKTDRALKILKQFTPSEHQHSVRFIVPTVSQVLQLRRLLLSDPEFPGLLGDPVCTFHRLASDIMASAGLTREKPVSDAQELLVLREVVTSAPSGYFDSVRHSPNFASSLGGAIRFLKSAGVTPEDLQRAVESAALDLPESSTRKIMDLADLYRSYQDTLAAHNIRDPESIMWDALEVARGDPGLLSAFKCVILDGFSTLTPVRREFIRLFAQQCDEVVITLEYEEDRPEVFSFAEPSMQFLIELPDVSVQHLPPRDDRANTAVGHLKRHLFAADPPKVEPDDTVAVLVGATPAMEIELVAGEIKRLVRERGFQYSEIGVVARDVRPYLRRIKSVFRQFRIPLAAQMYPLWDSVLARTVLETSKADGTTHPRQAVQDLMSNFEWPQDDERLREECAAWKAIQRIMAETAASEEMMGREFSGSQFAELLASGVRRRMYRMPGGDEEGVSLVDANVLVGGRKFRAAFVIGLVDRLFPRRGREDPFVRDWEREILNRYLPYPFLLRAHEQDHERWLFYTAAGSAQDRLYLCYSQSDASGRRNLPSTYVDEVDALFTRQVRRVAREPREVVPPMDEAETAKALVAGTILDCCTARDEQIQRSAAAAYNMLLDAGELGPGDFESLAEDEGQLPEERIPAHIRELLPNGDRQDTSDSLSEGA